MNKIKAFLCGVLEDGAGGFSCLRLLGIILSLVIAGVWVWGNARADSYVPLPMAEAGIIMAYFGAKAVQRKFEIPGADAPGASTPEAGARDGAA
ncbi:MAG: hypothetical protein LBD82_07080 [Deltaproteobacteria bacterium]|nr:hypothetical protein [Deltaproteobacteria bacterium]